MGTDSSGSLSGGEGSAWGKIAQEQGAFLELLQRWTLLL